LWHGNAVGALQLIGDLGTDLFELESDYPNSSKFITAEREFAAYIATS
jgi:hypothetical protein